MLAAVVAATVVFGCVDSSEPPPPREAASRPSPTPAPEEPKIPPAVQEDLEQGRARDVLVLVDDRTVRAKNGALSASSAELVAFSETAYDATKSVVRSSLPTGEFDERRHYSHLPYLHLTLRTPKALAALAKDDEVVRVYEDRQNEPFLTNSLPLIHQPAAAAANKTGAGGTIVVIDTGLDYTHAAFGSCVSPGSPGSCRVPYVADIATDDGQLDANGHGTNVAGIVAGVAPGAQVIGLDVFNAGNTASSTDVIAAINWAIANQATYNIVAMNLSLGAGSFTSACGSDVFASAIANARSAGILAAIASGNSGYSNSIASPACVPGAVSVGAVYSTSYGPIGWAAPCTDASPAADHVTCFSNSASFLTLLAPGAMITAAGITQGGTSQASPHVAGSIGVLRTAFPTETVSQTVARLTSTGTAITDPRQSRVTPRIDLDAASQGCFLQLSPTSVPLIQSSTTTNVNVTVGNGCAWTATSGAAWLTITSGSSGTGNGVVALSASTNPGPAPRTTTLTVAGITATVVQDGDPPPASKAPPSCEIAISSGYVAASKTLTLTLVAQQPLVIIDATTAALLVNHVPCVTPQGATISPSMVNRLLINGTSANETVILDMSSGPLAGGLASGSGGLVVDLAGGQDTFAILGTSGVDKIRLGLGGSTVFAEATGDNRADLAIFNTEIFRFSLGAGNDTFSAMGGAVTATHLNGPSSLTPMTVGVTVHGDDGDDTIQGGMGDDILYGGNGDDTFLTAATADGNDTYHGEAGTDTMSYASRTAAVTVSLDGSAGDGDLAAGENDDVGSDVENLIGGSGNDVLTGNQRSNWIRGGAGNDILSGGPAGTCASDVDILDGEAGNDTFDMGSSVGCGDKLIGGAGVDTADYHARTQALQITIDGLANDGESAGAEGDNVGLDVERVLGGSGNDVITGGAGDDELHGGPGNDTLNGGAGNDTLIGDTGNDILNGNAGDDTFLESGNDTAYNPALARGAGDDVINGGTGSDDLVDYSGRSAPLSLTICVDPATLSGQSSLPAAACTDHDGASGESDQLVNVNHILGGTNDDVITGGSGDDILEGGAGNDTIHGGAGNDRIYGDAGNDSLYGDAGDDLLDGVSGTDLLDGGGGDGDICVSKPGDTVLACEL